MFAGYRRMAIGTLCLGLFSVGCVNVDKYEGLRLARDGLRQQLDRSQTEVSASNAKAASYKVQLDQLMAGRRDEKARQVMASYVDEIVVDPATKTGYMVVNAGLGDPEGDPQKPDDPPDGGSQVTGVAGAGFEPATSGL